MDPTIYLDYAGRTQVIVTRNTDIMRLFDNAAIKIELFPSKKDKQKIEDGINQQKSGVSSGAARTARIPAAATGKLDDIQQAGAQARRERQQQQSQHIDKAADGAVHQQQGGDTFTYTANNTQQTGQPSETLEATHVKPARNYIPRDEGTGAVQQTPNPAPHNPQEAVSRNDYEPVRKKTDDDQSPPRGLRRTGSARDLQHDQPETNHDEFRSTRYDELIEDEKRRTNIPKGAPHSTGHALRKPRSRVELAKASENMARTLSRSPARGSPARKQPARSLRSVSSYERPGTSSTTGSGTSSKLAQELRAVEHSSPERGRKQVVASDNPALNPLANPERSPKQTLVERVPDESERKNSSKHHVRVSRCDWGYSQLRPPKEESVAETQRNAFDSMVAAKPSGSGQEEPNAAQCPPLVSTNRANHAVSQQGHFLNSPDGHTTVTGSKTVNSAPRVVSTIKEEDQGRHQRNDSKLASNVDGNPGSSTSRTTNANIAQQSNSKNSTHTSTARGEHRTADLGRQGIPDEAPKIRVKLPSTDATHGADAHANTNFSRPSASGTASLPTSERAYNFSRPDASSSVRPSATMSQSGTHCTNSVGGNGTQHVSSKNRTGGTLDSAAGASRQPQIQPGTKASEAFDFVTRSTSNHDQSKLPPKKDYISSSGAKGPGNKYVDSSNSTQSPFNSVFVDSSSSSSFQTPRKVVLVNSKGEKFRLAKQQDKSRVNGAGHQLPNNSSMRYAKGAEQDGCVGSGDIKEVRKDSGQSDTDDAAARVKGDSRAGEMNEVNVSCDHRTSQNMLLI